MSQEEKSSITCFVILIAIAVMTTTSLLLLRQRAPSTCPSLKSNSAKIHMPAAVPQSRPVAEPGTEATDAKATNCTKWDLEAWLRKPSPRSPSYSVMPVVDKKTIGLEFSVIF